MTAAPPPPPAPPVPPTTEPPTDVLPPAPGPAPRPGRPPLRRSRQDKVIGGVCGGLAEHTGIDALLWRVGAIALTFAGGAGLLVYLLLWVLMPRAGSTADSSRRSRRILRIGIAVLAVLAVVGIVLGAVFGDRWGRDGRGGPGFGFGDRDVQPRSAGAVADVYESGSRDLDVDLSRIDVSDLDEPIETRIESGAGDVEVRVPEAADVQVRVDEGAGDVDVFDADGDPGLYPGSGSASWTDDGQPEFVITLDSGAGDIELTR
ncbi:PspC domain-containing protein [Modestobacter sp. I12A-02628]|uniref:PspC domain-containing protein n=1 Tax=Goekera deserti TaxID=2497753 RepID=A0A7K3W8C2_9ACTN|nr:PspC domain-containing protein [Goekera deserti]MPR00244.1 PspC domain-containing protein [Goekera deserti]NDI49418.1 PspC domain-containing protein [Goekera deserti]NEL52708.1 PspC domain-containing protein [Goekera deserti]